MQEQTETFEAGNGPTSYILLLKSSASYMGKVKQLAVGEPIREQHQSREEQYDHDG